ncbi:MAG: helicase-exonuclease AddAB subunit AddA [Bacillota bacterium]
MINWTNNQRQAFESRNQNLLLSAAAGSGKTAVLVKRIISLIINDKVEIDKMLIITFTKAAAGEMKERIVKGLSKALTESKFDNKFLRKQINMVNNANISTIHSFCMEVIKRNFHSTIVDPSFSILDSTEKEIYFTEAVEKQLEIEYEKKKDEFINLVERYTSNRSDDELITIIKRIYNFIQSKPDSFKWLEEKIEFYKIDKEKVNKHIWIKRYKEILKRDLDDASLYLNEAKSIANESSGPKEYVEALDSDINLINNLKKYLKEDIDLFFKKINDISFKRLSRIKKERKKEIDKNLKKRVKDLRDNYKKIVRNLNKRITNKSLDTQIKELNELYKDLKYLVSIIKSIDEKFINKKIKENKIDFNDLEHFALDLLKSQEVSDFYKNKFEYIFVDEYQDTNLIQETIVNSIKREDNLFLVGDVKQSIYKFRLAEPDLFLNKYNRFSSKNNSLNRKIDLSKNFRTREEILDGINFIFKNLMSKDFGGIDYKKEVFLNKGLDFKKSKENFEINLINADKNSLGKDKLDDEIMNLKSAEIEAKAICKKVKSLIGKKTYDPSLNEFREIEYKDIVILMRATASWGITFEKIFSKQGVPLYFDGGEGYLNTLEIQIILNLLKIIDNKRNDIELISVMRSVIGNFSIEEIIEIRLKFKEKSYYKSLEKVSKLNTKLGLKARKFLNKLQEWFEKSKYLPIDEFINNIFYETNFLNFMSAMPGGNLRKGNLKLLVQKAKKFSESSITGLYNFIRFIENIGKVNSDFDTANMISENENVVRLMSIHKSKGLEFPIVILSRGARRIQAIETRNKITLHKKYGIATNYIDYKKRVKSKTIPKMVIDNTIKEENISEEMRIMYVAMTRAVDKLIVYGTITRGFDKKLSRWISSNSEKFINKSKTYIGWILRIMSNIKSSKPLYDYLDKEKIFENNIDLFNLNIYGLDQICNLKDNLDKEKLNLNKKLQNIDCKNYDLINKRFSFKYNRGKNKAMKVSVSDLKNLKSKDDINQFKLFKNIPQLQKEPKFVTEAKGLSPFDIGNTYHFIMEKIDFRKTSLEEIKTQISYLYKKGYISKKQMEIVDINEIFLFFNSKLGKRIKEASNVYREKEFSYKYNKDLLVQGIIDLYFEEDNKLVIVDYKTDKINKSNKELLKKEHKPQLDLYAKAITNLTQKPVKEKYLYFFKNQKFYKIE